MQSQLNECKKRSDEERRVEAAGLEEDIHKLEITIASQDKSVADLEAVLRQARQEMDTLKNQLEEEIGSRKLLADMLEEANMNLARLGILIKDIDEEKKAGVREIEELTARMEREVDSSAKLSGEKESVEANLARASLEKEELVEKCSAIGLELERDKLENSKLLERDENSNLRLSDREERVKALEEELKILQSKLFDMREAELDRAREEMGKVSEIQGKVEEANRDKLREVEDAKSESRKLEVELTKTLGQLEKATEKTSTLETAIADLKAVVAQTNQAIDQHQQQSQEKKSNEVKIVGSLNKSQKSIHGVQRVFDRKLPLLKVELNILKETVSSELSSFGKDFLEIIKKVHNKWEESHKHKTRRMTMHFEGEMDSLKQSLVSDNSSSQDALLREEAERREEIVAEKNDEIDKLNGVIVELREKINSVRTKGESKNEALRERLQTETGEFDSVQKEKDKLNMLNENLEKRVVELEVSERSERALVKTRILLAMNFAKWLQT